MAFGLTFLVLYELNGKKLKNLTLIDILFALIDYLVTVLISRSGVDQSAIRRKEGNN